MDNSIIPILEQTYQNLDIQHNIYTGDIITDLCSDILFDRNKKYDFIIMNPPYRKINTNSNYKQSLRFIGIETVNTYSAFMAIAIILLSENGTLTAIVPRSFCNGAYFLPFRKFLMANTVILHIHSFATRNDAFSDENILQENIIITLKKTKKPNKSVVISHSSNKLFSAYKEEKVSYSDVVNPDDIQLYISIPNSSTNNLFSLPCRHTDLSFDISTGPIVDFRVKENLVFNEADKGIPLLYAAHIRNQKITWPLQSKKPDTILLNNIELKKCAFQRGYYILVKRFSAKEEKRRIYATLFTPDSLTSEYFTVENHLNIIHCKHGSLNKDIAFGLVAYLNTTYCDNLFRNFSGHTQVNATDLRNMKYPSFNTLITLGKLTQGKNIEEYDSILQSLILKDAG
jgi:adenine-specific DNA-methyltransferase